MAHLSELLQRDNLSYDPEVKKISTDSRELDADTWWLAARGVSAHALDYAGDDFVCAGVVYEPPYSPTQAEWVAYPNLAHEIGNIAARFYGYPSRQLQVFAVTGTDGKSSLVHLLAQLLDAAMIGTIGNGQLDNLNKADHTTPDALSMQRLLAEFVAQDIKSVAMEVSSHALDQGRVAGVEVDVALFTNLSRDHLDYHKTMEAYFRAKAKLFAQPIKHAIINIDDAYGRRLIEEGLIHPKAKIWAVSSHGRFIEKAHHHLKATDIVLHSGGINMNIDIDDQHIAVACPLLARFNVDNLLNVAACLLANGMQPAQLAEKFATLHGVPGRVERISLPNDGFVMVDYAHTPGALENALQGVRPHVKGQLWVIFGCGGNRDTGKRPLMAQAAERYADHVVITDDNPRHEDAHKIIDDIVAGLEDATQVQIIQPRDVAIRQVLTQMKPHDALLIAGKGHEDYQIIGDTRHYFSDQSVVRQWLEEA